MIRAFLFCVAWLAATTRGSAVPLHHIKSLMAPPTVAELRAISTHGRFERVVDEPDDLAGGRTNARLAAEFDATQLVYLSENAMRCGSGDGAVHLARGAVGEVVFDGVSDLCGFCEASAMSAHPCVARIVRRIDADRVVLGPVGDVWSLLRSLSVDFVHAPGNRTVDEIHSEARRRGEPLAGSEAMPLQFDAFSWNWDSKTRGVLERDHPIPEWSAVGIETVCAECYGALTLGVEFTLRMSLNGWSVPTVDVLKFVPFGELSLASVIRTTLPLSRELTLSTDLFRSAILPRPLVIPLGLLAITIRPELMLKLELTAAISNPISLTLGAKQVSNVRLGVQLVNGQPLEHIRGADQTNTLVGSLTGFTPDALTVHAIAGIRAELAFGIGLTLAVLALLPQPKPLVTVSLYAKPQLQLGVVPSMPSQGCTLPWGYAAQAGLLLGAEVSPVTIDLGLRSFELTFGGALPYAAEFSAIEMQSPPGCSACTGCLGALDRLASTVVALRGPTVLPSPLPSLNNPDDQFVVTIGGGATSVSIGAPLTVVFNYQTGSRSSAVVSSASLAVEVRQATNSTVLQTVISTNEQLANLVPFPGMVQLSSLRPFTMLSLTPGVSKVRFVVIASHSDDVYGKSVWLDVRAPTAAASSAPVTRVVGGWLLCSVQCGSGGTQTRVQTCMTGDGARATPCPSTAQPSILPLQRTCSSLMAACPFVPYSVIAPVPHNIFASLSDWTPQRTIVLLTIDFGGGQVGRLTRISACYADLVSPCSTTRPSCMLLDEILPNTRGSTRLQVELGPQLLHTLAQPRPVPLTLLFENVDGGANDWALSPAIVVRAPDLTYALDGDIGFVDGAVSVGGVFGAAVLVPSMRYRRTTADIGYPSRIAFKTKRDGRFSIELRLEFPGTGIPFTYIISDYRKNKVAASLVAYCEPLLMCRICDPDDMWCLHRDSTDQFRQQLPPVCVGRSAAANPAVPVVASMQCGTSGVAGVCQDSRTVACPSPRRYVRNKCINTPAYIKCCPTLSQMSLLEAEGGVDWDDGSDSVDGGGSNSGSVDVGAIVGGVVGGVLLIGCLIAIIVYVVMRRRRVVFDLGDAADASTLQEMK